MKGRGARAPQAGGPIQPDALVNWNLPLYVNAWKLSLQIPGASLYSPHWILGEPSASGPRNAFARASTAFDVMPVLPVLASLRNRTVVSIWPKATMCHGSGAFLSAW